LRNSRISPLDLFVLVFCLSAVPALWIGYDFKLGLPALIAVLGGGFVYLQTVLLARDRKWWRRVAGGFIVVGAVIALYFITQAGRLEYAEKVEFITRLSAGLSSFFPAFTIWKPQTNGIATFLEALLFLCIPFILQGKTIRNKMFWGLTGGLVALALLLSASRGAWLAIFTAAALWVSLYWRPLRWILVVAAVVVIGVSIYVFSLGSLTVIERLPLIGQIFYRPDRFDVIRNSWLLALDLPFTGIGLGDHFSLVYSRYQLLYPHIIHDYAHNFPLTVWLQQGFFGIITWIGVVTSALVTLRMPERSFPHLEIQSAWFGLLAFLLHGLVDARMAEDYWCWLPFFVLLGLLSARSRFYSSRINMVQRWMPWGAITLFLIIFSVSRNINAVFLTNRAALAQQRADLAPDLSDEERISLREQARSGFLAAQHLDMSQRGANQRLGIIALETHDFNNAVQFFSLAEQTGPVPAGVYRGLGLAYTLQGELTEGWKYLTGQYDIVNELNYWGWYYATNDQAERSKFAYRQSLQLDPDQPAIQSLAESFR
jgi:hypothetical protein